MLDLMTLNVKLRLQTPETDNEFTLDRLLTLTADHGRLSGNVFFPNLTTKA